MVEVTVGTFHGQFKSVYIVSSTRTRDKGVAKRIRLIATGQSLAARTNEVETEQEVSGGMSESYAHLNGWFKPY